MEKNMRTAFETLPESLINGQRIETHISKGGYRREKLDAHVFFNQRLIGGADIEEAKQETEISYLGIQVNLKRLKPYHAGFRTNYENWQVFFDYLEEST